MAIKCNKCGQKTYVLESIYTIISWHCYFCGKYKYVGTGSLFDYRKLNEKPGRNKNNEAIKDDKYYTLAEIALYYGYETKQILYLTNRRSGIQLKTIIIEHPTIENKRVKGVQGGNWKRFWKKYKLEQKNK